MARNADTVSNGCLLRSTTHRGQWLFQMDYCPKTLWQSQGCRTPLVSIPEDINDINDIKSTWSTKMTTWMSNMTGRFYCCVQAASLHGCHIQLPTPSQRVQWVEGILARRLCTWDEWWCMMGNIPLGTSEKMRGSPIIKRERRWCRTTPRKYWYYCRIQNPCTQVKTVIDEIQNFVYFTFLWIILRVMW